MATYTVYTPSRIGDARQRADRTVFVREGFSLAAFVFGPLYLLYRRLWLSALVWIAAAALLGGMSHLLGLPPASRAVLLGLLCLLTGFEAAVIRQAGLRWRGYSFAGLFTTPTLEQAERAFFDAERFREIAAHSPRSGGAAREKPSDIIGLFPRPGEA